MNLVEGLSREIARVTELRAQYETLRGVPNVIVEPQIRMMNSAIELGQLAMGGGEIAKMMAALHTLKEWQG